MGLNIASPAKETHRPRYGSLRPERNLLHVVLLFSARCGGSTVQQGGFDEIHCGIHRAAAAHFCCTMSSPFCLVGPCGTQFRKPCFCCPIRGRSQHVGRKLQNNYFWDGTDYRSEAGIVCFGLRNLDGTNLVEQFY